MGSKLPHLLPSSCFLSAWIAAPPLNSNGHTIMKERLKARLQPFKLMMRRWMSGQLSFMEFAYCKSMYFSQFGEDLFLAHFFSERKTGFYVDVGAFHPFNISNTCAFYKKGWRGMNIEPNPMSFRAFPKHRTRDINLNVAVDREEKEVVFNCLKELSGIDDDTHLFRDGNRSVQCRIKAMPLAKILQDHLPANTTIDFMSVDCEGHDAEVLRSNDWTRFKPQVILVEDHEKRAAEINAILASVGYRFDRKLGLTKVFIS